jgi:hypothetical protein
MYLEESDDGINVPGPSSHMNRRVLRSAITNMHLGEINLKQESNEPERPGCHSAVDGRSNNLHVLLPLEDLSGERCEHRCS